MGLQGSDDLLSSGSPTLPWLTAELPGTSGSIKGSPGDFVVEEIPAYEPTGEGPHVYVGLTREGETTQSLRRRLADALQIPPEWIGYAGLKDRHARTTQTFSILREDGSDLPALELDGVEVTTPPKRHRNKLKPGHLLGNRFEITVRDLDCPPADALVRAEAVAKALTPTGWPNYFGPQRQGVHGDNSVQGLAILRRKSKRRQKPWLRKLLLSAWQSERFDTWLAARISSGAFDGLLEGDVAKKTDTGGLFDVEDPAVELPRLRAHDIVYTGPMYGSKMRAPTPTSSPAAVAEAAILAEIELPDDAFKRARLPGTRRPGRIHPADLSVKAEDDALVFRFFLPKGAYATTVLREFLK